MIAGYRTVSCDAASLLAGIPPLYIMATCRKRIYKRVNDLKVRGVWSKEAVVEIKVSEHLLLIRQWEIYLRSPSFSGKRTRDAISPKLTEWTYRNFGHLGYHMTQLLTGHGSFSHYLFNRGKRPDESCFHCDSDSDTLEHTLSQCSAWSEKRIQLRNKLGLTGDALLTLTSVVEKILEYEEKWLAFTQFSREMIIEKEEEERRRRLLGSLQPDADSSPG